MGYPRGNGLDDMTDPSDGLVKRLRLFSYRDGEDRVHPCLLDEAADEIERWKRGHKALSEQTLEDGKEIERLKADLAEFRNAAADEIGRLKDEARLNSVCPDCKVWPCKCPRGGTVSYATEEEKNDQRALAERARQTIAKRRSE